MAFLAWAPNLDLAGSAGGAPAAAGTRGGDVRAWSRRYRHTFVLIGLLYALSNRPA